MSLNDPFQGPSLAEGEVVLDAAARAGEMDVAGLFASVVLGPLLAMGVAAHAHLLEHPQGPIDRRRVHRRQPPLDPAGHVLGCDVPLRAQDLADDRFPLGGDAIPALSQRADREVAGVHGSTLSQERCICEDFYVAWRKPTIRRTMASGSSSCR